MNSINMLLQAVDKKTLLMGGAALVIGGMMLFPGSTEQKPKTEKKTALNGVKKGTVKI